MEKSVMVLSIPVREPSEVSLVTEIYFQIEKTGEIDKSTKR